tara:strand:+ start:820 stop:1377 length:558 start_codon:yes stop_codon:yes gene_type:complete
MLDIKNYLNSFSQLVHSDDAENKISNLNELILKKSSNKNFKALIFGNGGSASIADHFAVDMTKNAGIRTLSLNTAPLITCLANDFGYEQWMQKAVEMYHNDNDILFLISSSGNSQNVINACNFANDIGIDTITFTGFNPDNGLRSIGKYNFWVDSKSYNIVENIHQIWILTIVDAIIGKSEYSAS